MNNPALILFILLFFALNASASSNSAVIPESSPLVQTLDNSQVQPVDSGSIDMSIVLGTAFSSEKLSLLNKEMYSKKTSKNDTLSGPVVEEAIVSIWGRYKELANPVFQEILLA